MPSRWYPEVAEPLVRLAELLHGQGRNSDAEALCYRSMTIWQKGYGPKHIKVGEMLKMLSKLCFAQEKMSEGEAFLKQAFEIVK